MVRKRRTRAHVIADLSVNHVERSVLLAGFTIDRLAHDYGLDLLLVTYNENGAVEPGQVFLQVKATDSPRVSADGQRVSCQIERADLERWLDERMPVILVLYDARRDVAYWTYVQADIDRPAGRTPRPEGRTVAISLPTSNRLDVAAVQRFARFRDEIQALTREVIHHHE